MRGNVLADHIHRRTDAQAPSDSEQESVVVVGEFARQLVRIVHPDRLEVERAVAAELARQHNTQCR